MFGGGLLYAACTSVASGLLPLFVSLIRNCTGIPGCIFDGSTNSRWWANTSTPAGVTMRQNVFLRPRIWVTVPVDMGCPLAGFGGNLSTMLFASGRKLWVGVLPVVLLHRYSPAGCGRWSCGAPEKIRTSDLQLRRLPANVLRLSASRPNRVKHQELNRTTGLGSMLGVSWQVARLPVNKKSACGCVSLVTN